MPEIIKQPAPVADVKAVFSTNFGARPAQGIMPPLAPVIVRSTPVQTAKEFARKLRQKHTKLSLGIFPLFRLQDYFDPFNIHMLNPSFIFYVFRTLAWENVRLVLEFSADWSVRHRERLHDLCGRVDVEDVFDPFALQWYGPVFLSVALRHMRAALATLAHHQMTTNPTLYTQVFGKIETRSQERYYALYKVYIWLHTPEQKTISYMSAQPFTVLRVEPRETVEEAIFKLNYPPKGKYHPACFRSFSYDANR